MSRSIPDGWLDYKPIGEPIKGTRFIAFKVPLSPGINEGIRDSNKRLQITQILEQIPNLGLVIDLTNTARYYRPEGFSSNGVKHIKLMVPGKQVPNRNLVRQFTNYVKEFIENSENEGKLIGVHCTHGLNRTGYLICHFMINNLQIDPEEAIKDFEEARGHQMERLNYLDSLRNKHENSSSQDNHESDYGENLGKRNSVDTHPVSWRSTIPRSENNGYRPSCVNLRAEGRPIGDRPRQRPAHGSDDNHRNGWRSSMPRSDHSDRRHPYETNRPRHPENDGRESYNNNDSRPRAIRDIDNTRRSRFSRDHHERSNYSWDRSRNENGRSNNESQRRDPLPSNDFPPSFSVMDQLYGGTSENSYGRYNRR